MAIRAASDKPLNASFCAWAWPERVAVNPSGARTSSNVRSTAAAAVPRSLPGATFAVTSTIRCRYLRLISTGPLDRVTFAMAASGTSAPEGERTEMSLTSSMCERYRSSIRTLMKYSLPDTGSVNCVGSICDEPVRLVSTVCATSDSVSPRRPAFSRSTCTSSCG